MKGVTAEDSARDQPEGARDVMAAKRLFSIGGA
jgi:hypothetical protein